MVDESSGITGRPSRITALPAFISGYSVGWPGAPAWSGVEIEVRRGAQRNVVIALRLQHLFGAVGIAVLRNVGDDGTPRRKRSKSAW